MRRWKRAKGSFALLDGRELRCSSPTRPTFILRWRILTWAIRLRSDIVRTRNVAFRAGVYLRRATPDSSRSYARSEKSTGTEFVILRGSDVAKALTFQIEKENSADDGEYELACLFLVFRITTGRRILQCCPLPMERSNEWRLEEPGAAE